MQPFTIDFPEFEGRIFVMSEGKRIPTAICLTLLIYCFMIRYKIYQNQQKKS